MATAAHYMGVAHPSGYPFYLLIVKAFTFLPMGNIAFRVAVVTALFASLSLGLLYGIVRSLSTGTIASLFTVTILFSSYAFFSQSVIAKFYTLNLFLILVVFALYIAWSQSRSHPLLAGEGNEGMPGYLYLMAFLSGLSLANHHTGVIIAGPVLIGIVLQRWRVLTARALILCAALVLLGFMMNLYIVLRGNLGNFFSAVYINDLGSFYDVITRQAYKESGTISATVSSFGNGRAYWLGFVNFLSITTRNFSSYSYLLFFLGCYYLAKMDYKTLIVAMLSLLFYGPFLARITLGSENLSENSYYIGANQYFLPALAFYVIFLGLGFHQLVIWLKRLKFRFIAKAVPVIMALFPLAFLVSRATDSNYRTNYVAYQVTKDLYSALPVKSIMLAFGDNATYQGWYLKVLGRYREDIGQLSSPHQEKIIWDYQGCREGFYGDIFPMVYTRKFREFVPLMLSGRFYGSEPVKPGQAYDGYIRSIPFSLAYLYLPIDKHIEGKTFKDKDISRFIAGRMLIADRIISIAPCLSHFTDDLFTRRLCSQYSIHLNSMARLFSGEEWDRTGEVVEVRMSDGDKGTVQSVYYIDITQKNEPYLALSSQIQEFNQWKILYLRK